MSASIKGYVLDETNGQRIASTDVRLYRIGVPGEIYAVLTEDGGFSFDDLHPGEYSLGIYGPRYVSRYERIILKQDEAISDLKILLAPGGFISGKILDEAGQLPKMCWFTLLREGERNGKQGYISDSGDHQAAQDGTFCSPPLAAGKYLLRFAGMLQAPTDQNSSEPVRGFFQQRVFDFLYPNARDVNEASAFSVEVGQRIEGLQITIPRPVWRTVRGRITGPIPQPQDGGHISVMFAQDLGSVDQIGGAGGTRMQPDGSFETMAQPGRHFIEVCEFAPVDPTGRTRMGRRFGSTAITVGEKDVSGVEVAVSSEGQSL